MQHRLLRWLPAVVAPVVIAGAVAIPLTAAAAVHLDPKTPAQVLHLVAKARALSGFSGTVEQRSDLGLPEIPSAGAGSDSDTGSALEAVTGDHTARVWVAGASRSRIAVLDSTGERDVVRDGSTVWTWDSDEQRATKVVLPERGSASPRFATATPQDVADRLLAAVDDSTRVTVDDAQRVAGHDAYTLVLTPRTSATTVGSVRVAVDAATGLPLRVQVFARDTASPAAEIGFSSVDIAEPAASVFRFTPPSGATVKEQSVPKGDHRAGPAPSGANRPTVHGQGWAAVAELSGVPASVASNPTLVRLSTAVPGGRVVHSSLVNVLLTDDGRVFAGAVPVSRLTAVAAG